MNIPYHKTVGIIIKSRSFGETGKHLTIYTKSFGKINAIAKGAKKVRSRFGSSLELFTESELFMFKKEHKDLYLITQTKINKFLPNISKDIKKFGVASVISEFIYNFVPYTEKNIQLYNFFSYTLHLVNCVRYEEKVQMGFMVKFLSLVGYKINLNSCSSCNEYIKINSGLIKNLSARFGGIICSNCGVLDVESIKIPNSTLKILEYLQKKGFYSLSKLIINKKSEEDIKSIVSYWIEYYFESRLKSLKVMESINKYG
ncbi:MAG: DNA repair protein RecO [Candidatus Firestonebacteria bacterium]